MTSNTPLTTTSQAMYPSQQATHLSASTDAPAGALWQSSPPQLVLYTPAVQQPLAAHASYGVAPGALPPVAVQVQVAQEQNPLVQPQHQLQSAAPVDQLPFPRKVVVGASTSATACLNLEGQQLSAVSPMPPNQLDLAQWSSTQATTSVEPPSTTTTAQYNLTANSQKHQAPSPTQQQPQIAAPFYQNQQAQNPPVYYITHQQAAPTYQYQPPAQQFYHPQHPQHQIQNQQPIMTTWQRGMHPPAFSANPGNSYLRWQKPLQSQSSLHHRHHQSFTSGGAMTYGRSDRLRRLAEELSRSEQRNETAQQSSVGQFNADFFGRQEKDNTSASQSSKSYHAESNNNMNVRFTDQRQKQSYFYAQQARGNHPFAITDEEEEDIDHQNRTVSEILSMLSGSGDSHQATITPAKEQASTFAPAAAEIPPISDFMTSSTKKRASANAPQISLSEQILQDEAIQEVKTQWDANVVATSQGTVVDAATTDLGSLDNRRRFVQKKPKQEQSPVVLAEDEAIDKMIYYDKSSCMHAPKATQVPIF